MPYDDVTLTREKLYEEVWARAVTQVAKEIGVSDVAIAKICRKLNVPVPPRGYWARVAAGHTPKKPPLPTPTATTAKAHVFRIWRAPEGAIAPTVKEDDAPLVTVETTLESPHRLIRTSRAYLQRVAKEYDGPDRPKEQVLDVEVSEVPLERALRVMDALVKALEERGHCVEVREVKPPRAESPYGRDLPQPEPRWHTFAVVENTAVEFGLEEGYETIDVLPPPPSGLRESQSWGLPRPVKERIPNGRLVLTIRNAPRSERLTCGDTKRLAIETRLGAFIRLLEATSSAIKEAEVSAAKQAEEHRRWEEERQKAETRRLREEALVRDLQKRLDLWLTATRCRQLADAVEAMVPPTDDAEDRRASWLVWLRSYAARVERNVAWKLPDPERGPERDWGY